MDLQEQFDFVVNHLRKQGRISLSANGACNYRGHSGLRCAAGALIPDSVYDCKMERKDWSLVAEEYKEVLPQYLTEPDSVALVQALQEIHDNECNVDTDTEKFIHKNLEKEFKTLACTFGLKYTPPKGVR